MAKCLLQFLPVKLMKEDKIFRAFDSHSVEIVSQSKYIAEYEQM